MRMMLLSQTSRRRAEDVGVLQFISVVLLTIGFQSVLTIASVTASTTTTPSPNGGLTIDNGPDSSLGLNQLTPDDGFDLLPTATDFIPPGPFPTSPPPTTTTEPTTTTTTTPTTTTTTTTTTTPTTTPTTTTTTTTTTTPTTTTTTTTTPPPTPPPPTLPPLPATTTKGPTFKLPRWPTRRRRPQMRFRWPWLLYLLDD